MHNVGTQGRFKARYVKHVYVVEDHAERVIDVQRVLLLQAACADRVARSLRDCEPQPLRGVGLCSDQHMVRRVLHVSPKVGGRPRQRGGPRVRLRGQGPAGQVLLDRRPRRGGAPAEPVHPVAVGPGLEGEF